MGTNNWTIDFVEKANTTLESYGNGVVIKSDGWNNNNYRTVTLASIYSFIFILGTFGNLLVVIATRKFVNLRKPTNILICNLCICDIAILVIGIPMFVIGEDKISHIVACKTLSPLLITVLTATVLSLVVIALERYFTIVHHFKKYRLTIDRAYIVVIALDMASLLLGVPLCFSLDVIDGHCKSQWPYLGLMVYRISLFMIQYILPLTLMSYVYSRSWQTIRRKNSFAIRLSNSNRSSIRRSHEDGLHNDEGFKTMIKSSSNNHLAGMINQQLKRTSSSESIRSGLGAGRGKLSRSSSFQELFRGSVTRVNRSFTSVVTGADSELVATSFVLQRSKQTIATLKIFTYIVVLFGVCMLPHHIIDLLHVTESELFLKNSKYVNILDIFVFVNAAVNPWVYAGLNIQYRVAFRRLFNNNSNNRLGNLMRNNLFRSPSGTLVLSSKKRINNPLRVLVNYFPCVEHTDISAEETKEITEFKERKDSCTVQPMKNRNGSKLSKASRKDSIDPESDIPISLPIIMVSNYDDEMGDDNYFNHEFWYRDISFMS